MGTCQFVPQILLIVHHESCCCDSLRPSTHTDASQELAAMPSKTIECTEAYTLAEWSTRYNSTQGLALTTRVFVRFHTTKVSHMDGEFLDLRLSYLDIVAVVV